ncbi:MAG: hypothetical protein LBD21_05420 [Tannerellaceae bacterium]|jgi:hypothetical protein|nr:hypothetical protein [Tannerellaceae bacterium]
MAANKKAIDFGKIKRYIKNRTAEFYINSLQGDLRADFRSKILYLDNVQRTKDLSPNYDESVIEKIKKKLTNFSPTREQKRIINSINRQTKDDNARLRKSRENRKASGERQLPDERTLLAVDSLIRVIEGLGVSLTSQNREALKSDAYIVSLCSKSRLQ